MIAGDGRQRSAKAALGSCQFMNKVFRTHDAERVLELGKVAQCAMLFATAGPWRVQPV